MGEGGCDCLLFDNKLLRISLIRTGIEPLGRVAEPGGFEVADVVYEDFGALLKHKLRRHLKHDLRQLPTHTKAETA